MHALLVAIFVARVFVFVESQFGAVFGLAVDLLLLVTVHYMIEQERRSERTHQRQSWPRRNRACPGAGGLRTRAAAPPWTSDRLDPSGSFTTSPAPGVAR